MHMSDSETIRPPEPESWGNCSTAARLLASYHDALTLVHLCEAPRLVASPGDATAAEAPLQPRASRGCRRRPNAPAVYRPGLIATKRTPRRSSTLAGNALCPAGKPLNFRMYARTSASWSSLKRPGRFAGMVN